MFTKVSLLLSTLAASNVLALGITFGSPWTNGLINKDYSKNIVYNIGEHVQIQWTPSVNNANMTIAQDNFPGDALGGPTKLLETSIDGSQWSWDISYGGLNPNYHNVYYLTLSDADGNSGTTHYFNISDLPATSSSSTMRSTATSASSSTTSASSTTSSASGTMTSASPATSSQSPGSIDTSLNGGTIAAIVIGAVLGILLLAGAIWFLMRRRKNRAFANGRQMDASASLMQQSYNEPYYDATSKTPVAELSALSRPQELSGTSRAVEMGNMEHKAQTVQHGAGQHR